jgi:hypothetical protein
MAYKRKSQSIEQVETHHTRQVRAAAIRDATGDFAIDDKQHRMWFLATSTDRCDDGMAIDATAWERDMPEHVPFVDSHARHSIKLIYGRVVDKRYTPRGPVEQVEFAADAIHPDGQLAWYLYRHGYASDVSIAWTTLEKESRKDDDGREYVGVTRARQEELSGCIIGLDPKAESLHSDAELVALARSVVGGHCGKCQTRPGWDEPENGHMIHYQVRPPEGFDKESMTTLSLDVKAESDVQIVKGKLTGGDEELHAQSVRFDKDKDWTMSEAKDWWASHKDELGRESDSMQFAESLLSEVRELRAVCNALLVRMGEFRAVPIVEMAKPEPAYIHEMRRTAKAVTLTGPELLEQLTRHGSDADAETRS